MDDWRRKILDEMDFLEEKRKTLDKEQKRQKIREIVKSWSSEKQDKYWEVLETEFLEKKLFRSREILAELLAQLVVPD